MKKKKDLSVKDALSLRELVEIALAKYIEICYLEEKRRGGVLK